MSNHPVLSVSFKLGDLVQSTKRNQERIESNAVPNDAGCWEWTKSRDRLGYAKIQVGRKNMTAHRFAFLAFGGTVPEGQWVYHTCRSRSCVNPSHLRAGTRSEALRGKMKSGNERANAHTAESIRAMASPDPESGCWQWTGRLTPNGYGAVNYQGRKWLAHRLFVTLERGEIAAGLQLDHLCRNRACVNPAHLEAVDQATNIRRGDAFKNRDGKCHRCGAQTVRQRCRECKNARNRMYMRAYHAKKRAANE